MMAATENPVFTRQQDGDSGQEMMDIAFAKRGCCYWMPFFGSERQNDTGSVWWEKIRNSENEESWWKIGWNKFREWSEIIAGPRWKTFIRRFNKNRGGGGGKNGKFQYDPLSYALNFDEGHGQNGHLDNDHVHRNFSSRYASIPISVKSSVDLGKDGPCFT